MKAVADEASLIVDLDFGPFADLNASASSPTGAVVDETSKHVGQAVLSYTPAGSRLIFEAGKMYSHMDVETAKSKDNLNYSRSTLFSYGIPFWHTGIHIAYDVIPSELQTGIYIYNGWNSIYATNSSKTIGTQIRFTPAKDTAFTYNFIGGQGRPDSESDWKLVNELSASVPFYERHLMIADFIYGTEDGATQGTSKVRAEWYGGILGARFQLNEKSYISPRIEFYRDGNGATLVGPSQTLNGITLTYGRTMASNLKARVEARTDLSNEATFVSEKGFSKSQSTILVAALFHF